MNGSQQDVKSPFTMGEESNEPQQEELNMLDDNITPNTSSTQQKLGRVGCSWKFHKILKIALIILGIMSIFITGTIILMYKANPEMQEVNMGCKQGWINVSRSCFLFAPHTCQLGCTWEFSNDFCRNIGGKLAEPHEQIMDDLIKIGSNEEISKNKNYWVGLIRNDNDNNISYRWTTEMIGTKANISIKRWEKDEPRGDEIVHFTNKMKLDDRKPINANVPICQRLASHKGSCQQDWYYKEGKCFKFLLDSCIQRCDWYTATQECGKVNSILAEDEVPYLIYLAREMKAKNNYWLGYKDMKKMNNYTGYTSGKEFKYHDYFAKREPSDVNENCIELNSDVDYLINDKSCKPEEWIRQFQPLCQYNL